MQQILTEIEEMQAFLEVTTSEKPEELVQRLSDLNVYLARSGKLLADMMEMQDKATALVFDEKKSLHRWAFHYSCEKVCRITNG